MTKCDTIKREKSETGIRGVQFMAMAMADPRNLVPGGNI